MASGVEMPRRAARRWRSARVASCARAPRSRFFRSARGFADCLAAAEELEAAGLSTTVADARFAKPLDQDLVSRLAREHEVLITVEEGAIGGFATHVLHHLAHEGLLDQGLKVRPLVLPDAFTDHGKPEKDVCPGRSGPRRHRSCGVCRAGPGQRKPQSA